ncbi:Lipid III flippase [compost metagenome]
MRELFAWQMLGDTLKIGSWILGYVLTAQAFWKIYIYTEVVFSFSFYLLVVFLVGYELESAAIAHALNYAVHFFCMFCILKFKKIFV